MADNRITIMRLKPFSEVKRIYSGHIGCACGCMGTYYSKTMEIERAKGYSTFDDEKNVRNFSRMLTRVKKIFEYELPRGNVKSYPGSENEYVFVEYPETNRTYTLYYTR